MTVFKWIEQCIVVEGFSRSAIYDLNRNRIHFVDKNINDLKSIIEGNTEEDILLILDETQIEWFNFLKEIECLVEVPKNCYSNFKPIEIYWDSPKLITQASIHENNNIDHCLSLLHSINCNNVTLIFEHDNDLYLKIKNNFSNTDLFSLDLYVKEVSKDEEYYIQLVKEFPVIYNINTLDKSKINAFHIPLFHFSIGSFMESQSKNVYFNQRIHIDENGWISNSPKTFKADININDLTILTVKEIINNSLITKYWNSSKVNTDICNCCEFRFQCNDYRQPQFREKDNKWYFETECSYNPFICKWSTEKGFHSLNECGVVTNEKEYKIDTLILENVMNKIW